MVVRRKDVKRIFLPYGKDLWVYENRVRKKIPPETSNRVWRKTHNTAFSNLYVNNINVIKLKKDEMSTARKIAWDRKVGTPGLYSYAFTIWKYEGKKQLGGSRRSYSNNIEISPLSRK
jgi:hypothetical protein